MEPQSAGESTITIEEIEDSNSEQLEDSISEDKLRSPVSSASDESASTEFSFEDPDPFEIERNQPGSLSLGQDKSELATDSGDNVEAITERISTLETPPAQVMEQPADTSGYRIPSSVFASSKPNADWSSCSNESLFSIHPGNMSFTRDQFSWMQKSGELGMYGIPDIYKSGEFPLPPPNVVQKSGDQMIVDLPKSGELPTVAPNTRKAGEDIIAAHFMTSSATPPAVSLAPDVELISSPKFGGAASIPVVTQVTKKDDPKPEKKLKKGKRSSHSEEVVSPSACVSRHSDTSCQSFAFPVLTDFGGEKSVNSGHSQADQQKHSSSPDHESPKTPTSAPETVSWWSWLCSWFSCCYCPSCCWCWSTETKPSK